MIDVRLQQKLGSFDVDVAFRSTAPVTALFGRSGAGKTSVINAIAGITRPDRGRIEIGNRVLMDTATRCFVPPEARRIGYVFQDGLLFPHLDVRSNLFYGHRRTPPADHYVNTRNVIQLLGLDHLLARTPVNLSGGERQRVAIGRALLASPRLLLLDEPLASLDTTRKSEILHYIELLRDELKIPILYVSHAQDEVIRLADHLVLLDQGRVAASGPVDEVLGNPDLRPLTGRHEAGAVFEARVVAHDQHFGLTTLAFAEGQLFAPSVDALPGERVRVRIRARDVALATTRPEDISILNVLAGRVSSVREDAGAIVEVRVALADTPGANTLTARITRRSLTDLGLAPGAPVFALIKAVALDRRSVGFA